MRRRLRFSRQCARKWRRKPCARIRCRAVFETREERGAKRDAVLLNAGSALYLGGKADGIKDGIALAGELLDSGNAMAMLEALKSVSKEAE